MIPSSPRLSFSEVCESVAAGGGLAAATYTAASYHSKRKENANIQYIKHNQLLHTDQVTPLVFIAGRVAANAPELQIGTDLSNWAEHQLFLLPKTTENEEKRAYYKDFVDFPNKYRIAANRANKGNSLTRVFCGNPVYGIQLIPKQTRKPVFSSLSMGTKVRGLPFCSLGLIRAANIPFQNLVKNQINEFIIYSYDMKDLNRKADYLEEQLTPDSQAPAVSMSNCKSFQANQIVSPENPVNFYKPETHSVVDAVAVSMFFVGFSGFAFIKPALSAVLKRFHRFFVR